MNEKSQNIPGNVMLAFHVGSVIFSFYHQDLQQNPSGEIKLGGISHFRNNSGAVPDLQDFYSSSCPRAERFLCQLELDPNEQSWARYSVLGQHGSGFETLQKQICPLGSLRVQRRCQFECLCLSLVAETPRSTSE